MVCTSFFVEKRDGKPVPYNFPHICPYNRIPLSIIYIKHNKNIKIKHHKNIKNIVNMINIYTAPCIPPNHPTSKTKNEKFLPNMPYDFSKACLKHRWRTEAHKTTQKRPLRFLQGLFTFACAR